ncbi:tripartite motif-containing protein 45 [Plakobranchus ocellatus]|uniref:Tripartite motif-containing protein 45 n=1 Tax=Plakobranchus ocellatus TaxID=259542 RepID=A0AAV4BQV6_9GAST|nr:tripartite motif-containing protein 45 [Plakobranchus ocellatus]
MISAVPSPCWNKTSPPSKEEILVNLDTLREQFVRKVDNYVSDVKIAINSETPESIEKIVHPAKKFLLQDVPDSTSQAGDGQSSDDEMNFQGETKARCLHKKLEMLRKKLQALDLETKDSIIDLREGSMENSIVIKGLIKLHNLVRQRNQAAAAFTSSPTSTSASAESRPLKDIRQSTDFSVKVSEDKHKTNIWDVQLLPRERLLLADLENNCIKLFDTQGQHLNTLKCWSYPRCLAVLHSSATSDCLAVTLPNCPGIHIVQVEDKKMRMTKHIRTTKKYRAVAAVTKHFLAVGYSSGLGIDLINMDGEVLRTICSSVDPYYMDITKDGDLVCSTNNLKIARVKVATGEVVFNTSVPEIQKLHGVAIASDGSILVTDLSNKTLHQVSSKGVWRKQLWTVPSDRDQFDELWSVSMSTSACVCVTWYGSVYMLDCVY